jgi:hypothetical protein
MYEAMVDTLCVMQYKEGEKRGKCTKHGGYPLCDVVVHIHRKQTG